MTISNESLGHEFTVGSVTFGTSIDIKVNVIKRRESIVYQSSVPANSTNIAFVGGAKISSEKNLSIADRSTSLAANRVRELNFTTIVATKTFNISTDNFVVTDVFVDETNTLSPLPLFLKHTLNTTLVPRDADGDLDNGVTLLEITLLDSLLQPIKTNELKIDRTKGIIYNNLVSKFTSSGDYVAYYVKYVVNDNGSINNYISLLDNETIYSLAEFDDLTIFMTIKTDGRKVYLIEEIPSGFAVTLPIIGTYAFQSLNSARIKILPPVPQGIADTWFTRIANGKFVTQVRGLQKKYFIAEFLSQAFDPEPPTKKVTLETSTILSSTVIKLDQENIRQDSALSLYINILVNDKDDVGQAAFTTDSSIVGNVASNGKPWNQWSNTNRFGIRSIDHTKGFIDIDGLVLKSDWVITSNYYHNEDKYEFTLVNFNPISNKNVLTSRVSLFIDPDGIGESSTQTLYFLRSDETGKVVESNWPDFDNDTMQWTVSGLDVYYESYPSWKPTSPHVVFVDSFTVEGTSGDFLLLGDITAASATHPDEFESMDSRRRGGGIIDTEIDDLVATFPEAQWYWDVGYWDGIPYPGNASYLAEVPVDILTDAGGVFTQAQVTDIINKHTAAGVYSVVKAYGLEVTVSGINPSANSITLEWVSDEY